MISELWDQIFYYLDALWRRRWLALLVAVGVAAAGWTYVAQMPSQYTSEAKIYVDTKSVLGPLLQGVAIDGDTQRQIEVMRQTLKTRSNMQEIVRRTDLDLQAESAEELDALAQRVSAGLTISSNQENIFTVSYTGRNPQLARDIVNEATTIFIENNLGDNRSDINQAQTFIRNQVQSYRERLNEAEQRLAEFKRENANTLPGNTSYGEELEQVKSKLAALRGALADARARVELLRRELEQTPEMLTQQGGNLGPPSNIDARIMELRAKLDDLKSQYTAEHPDVERAQRQLQSLMKEKSSGPSGSLEASDGSGPDRTSGTEGQDGGIKIPNPTYTDLRVQFVEARSNVESLTQQVARTQQALESLRKKRDEVFQVEAKLKELQRDYSVIQNRYQTMLSRLETAKMSEERNQQAEGVKFRMIENPQVPSAPSGPNRPVYLAAAFVLSVGTGGGLALFLGIIKTSFGSVQHIRREYDVPVLGTLSRQPEPGERKWRIINLAAFVVTSTAFVACFAGLLVVEQMYGLGNIDPGVLSRFGLTQLVAAVRG
ncbi:hypothetical protein CKO28_19175 [Rhodovibrio sodomensis]|uniref:Polysaccharide chain length determinant N-terminal domain-containing protein n=1 Tax=Rhodovibrio sodomensis TaxID=1088 RepID=A0ABS1DJR4_9PROT|nr:hypothetical protein [Rhodovibrio sodomensis]